MLYTYCQKCGSKNEYQLKKPKFCGHCGEPFSAESSKVKVETEKKRPSVASAKEIDEDGTDVFEVPDLEDLEYEISYDQASFTLGSLIGQNHSSEPKPEPKKKRGRPKKSKSSNVKKNKN